MTIESTRLNGATLTYTAEDIEGDFDIIPVASAANAYQIAKTSPNVLAAAMAPTLSPVLSPLLNARDGVKNLRDYAGFDNTGATDSTANWEAAMAGGGVIEIPAGTYLLDDCQIPNTVDVTLKPLGPVVIKHDGSQTYGALYARYITEGTHVSAPIAITGITRGDTTYPGTNDQALTKLTGASGAFSAFEEGDIVFIHSDTTDGAPYGTTGFICAEWAQVLATADSGATLFLTRPVNFTYSGATNFTIRRVLSTPKLRILPGITFEPSTDVTATPISRSPALWLDAPIDAEVSADFNNAYQIGVYVNSPFRGEYRCRFYNLHVDYSDDAYGYGLSIFGAGYRSKLWLTGEGGGHIQTLNGDPNATTYVSGNWYRHGVPTEIEVESLIAHNTRRSAWDSHWSYRTRTRYLSVSGTTMDADEQGNNTQAFGGAAVDPWFGTIIARDVYRSGYISECNGVATTYTIDNLQYDNPLAIAQRPIIGYEGSADAVQPKVYINSGYSRVATSYHMDFSLSGGASNRAPEFNIKNFTFFGGFAIARILYDNYGSLRLQNCTWEPNGVNTVNPIIWIDIAAPNTTVVIDGMRVRQDGLNRPNGVFRCVAAADTCKASVANLVCEQNASTALALYSSDSDGSGTVTALTVSAPTV